MPIKTLHVLKFFISLSMRHSHVQCSVIPVMEPMYILINFVKCIRTDLFQEDKNKNLHKNNKKQMIDVVHPKKGVGVENL